DCKLGDNCRLWPKVTLYYDVQLGHRAIIHSGVVIGSDGFGIAPYQGKWQKVPQLGGVRIGNDVEIGANTTIDRGAIDHTVIEDSVKLDNQIQIAHNVYIGAYTAIAGCVGVAGSATIGKHCLIGGASNINGHITITDGVIVTGMSMVTNSIKEPGIYSSGTGVMENRNWQKNVVRFRQLDKIARQLNCLEEELHDHIKNGESNND
ncbi:MAG: UDP-3-O-(3-hydroxymyristoyl)glucosamine N-acyltransferase, partial [Gammaproteobacteria bacterium]|nr:UDP-3-O-(3-hydroxymyristoyl)glucosamine N-acyltransferase [Gammaproteobacteria bacterium]